MEKLQGEYRDTLQLSDGSSLDYLIKNVGSGTESDFKRNLRGRHSERRQCDEILSTCMAESRSQIDTDFNIHLAKSILVKHHSHIQKMKRDYTENMEAMHSVAVEKILQSIENGTRNLLKYKSRGKQVEKIEATCELENGLLESREGFQLHTNDRDFECILAEHKSRLEKRVGKVLNGCIAEHAIEEHRTRVEKIHETLHITSGVPNAVELNKLIAKEEKETKNYFRKAFRGGAEEQEEYQMKIDSYFGTTRKELDKSFNQCLADAILDENTSRIDKLDMDHFASEYPSKGKALHKLIMREEHIIRKAFRKSARGGPKERFDGKAKVDEGLRSSRQNLNESYNTHIHKLFLVKHRLKIEKLTKEFLANVTVSENSSLKEVVEKEQNLTKSEFRKYLRGSERECFNHRQSMSKAMKKSTEGMKDLDTLHEIRLEEENYTGKATRRPASGGQNKRSDRKIVGTEQSQRKEKQQTKIRDNPKDRSASSVTEGCTAGLHQQKSSTHKKVKMREGNNTEKVTRGVAGGGRQELPHGHARVDWNRRSSKQLERQQFRRDTHEGSGASALRPLQKKQPKGSNQQKVQMRAENNPGKVIMGASRDGRHERHDRSVGVNGSRRSSRQDEQQHLKRDTPEEKSAATGKDNSKAPPDSRKSKGGIHLL